MPKKLPKTSLSLLIKKKEKKRKRKKRRRKSRRGFTSRNFRLKIGGAESEK